MALVERGMRRVFRHLHDGEVVVGSLTGVEVEGRRRRFIVVTDRRIMVGWVRGDTPVELALDGAVCQYVQPHGRFVLHQGEHEVVLRRVDEVAARALVELVTGHRRRMPTAASQRVPAVRILR